LLFAFAFLIVSVFIPAVLADPTVVRVTIDPAKPLPLSTITFTAILTSNETLDEVWLLVQECRVDLCFAYGFNKSMEQITNDTYQAQCTLMQEEATQIKYQLKIACNETWFTSNTTFVPLAVETKNNTSEAPHNQVSTPGFEIPLFVSSFILILVFNNWREKIR
jgi:hypothetical protein